MRTETADKSGAESLEPGSADPGGRASSAADGLRRAAEEAPIGLWADYLGFLKATKKWWMAPILIAILLIGILVVLSTSAAAPLIYPLF